MLLLTRIEQCLFIVNVILFLTHDKWRGQPLSYVNGNFYSVSAERRDLLIYVHDTYMYIYVFELHDQM